MASETGGLGDEITGAGGGLEGERLTSGSSAAICDGEGNGGGTLGAAVALVVAAGEVPARPEAPGVPVGKAGAGAEGTLKVDAAPCAGVLGIDVAPADDVVGPGTTGFAGTGAEDEAVAACACRSCGTAAAARNLFQSASLPPALR